MGCLLWIQPVIKFCPSHWSTVYNTALYDILDRVITALDCIIGGGGGGGASQYKDISYQYRDPMLKVRLSHDRLIFNMGIHKHGKDGLYIDTGPRSCPSMWCNHPYTSGLFHWHWVNHMVNHMISPVPAEQPWRIWVNWLVLNHNKTQHGAILGRPLGPIR